MKKLSKRSVLVRMHRWAGLLLAPFLVVVALTGSVLAFYHELDEALNPGLFRVAPAAAPLPMPIPAIELLALARQYSAAFGGKINQLPLKYEAGKSVMFRVSGAVAFDQLFLNPHNGEVLGKRNWGDLSQSPGNLVGFIYLLHTKLAVPGKLGVVVMGLVALLWTVDCLVALLITVPAPGRRAKQKSRWQQWRRVLTVRRSRKGLALAFDWHRAGGLWLWLLLLVFAWSGVGFNLPAAFNPVMTGLLGFQPYSAGLSRDKSGLSGAPGLDMPRALARARELQAPVESQYLIKIYQEDSLSYSPAQRLYRYRIRSDRDFNDTLSRTQLYFDADNGELIKVDLPSGQRAGNTVARWLYALHMGQVFGIGYKLVIAVVGLLTALLVYSGLRIWWNRKVTSASRLQHRQRLFSG